MRHLKKLMNIVLILHLFAAPSAWGNPSKWADMLIESHKTGGRIPVISKHHPGIDVKTAYRIQKAYVEKRLAKEKIAGFKAGLTSEAGQKKFGVDAPLAGVLFHSGKKTESQVIKQSAFNLLRIETEIGFVTGKPITRPVEDISHLRDYVRAVMPAIELPDLGFADMKLLKGVDIIAGNVAADQFIPGREREIKDLDINAVTVTLYLDGQVVNRGKGSDAMGDQWKAALWLVNLMVRQGYRIEPGFMLITGALGKMIPGKPGKYVADYGSFGKIAFEIK